MKVNIRGKENVKLSQEARGYITSKVEALEKLFNKSENLIANVLCKGYEKYTIVEITIPTKHVIFRSETKGDNLYQAVDRAVDKLEQQVIKHKKKVNSMIKKREGVSAYFSGLTNEEEVAAEEETKVVKTKEIELQVMSVDEAITQLELLDHDFYLFINEENQKVTVVYVRNEGGFGAIEVK